jgi:hypothetical protein
MGSMPVYKYTIPLEKTEKGVEPAYEYPEGDEISKYEEDGNLIVIQDRIIPHFHRDSIAVEVDVLVEDDFENEIDSP